MTVAAAGSSFFGLHCVTHPAGDATTLFPSKEGYPLVIQQAQAKAPARRQNALSPRAKRRARIAYAIIIPFLVYLCLWNLIPLIYGLYLGLTEYNGLTAQPKFIGLRNFRDFFSNPIYTTLLLRQLWMGALCVGLNTIISFAVALALNVARKGRGFFRSVIYIPCLTAASVTTSIFVALLESPNGMMDMLLKMMGMKPITWVYSQFWMTFWIVFYFVWKQMGPAAIIWLGGLQAIDPELYDAAKVDGANRWQQVRYITIPGLRFVTTYILLTGIFHAMQMFDVVMFISAGGPYGTTDVLMYHIYRNGIVTFNLGMAGAESTVLGLLTSIIAIVYFRVSTRKED